MGNHQQKFNTSLLKQLPESHTGYITSIITHNGIRNNYQLGEESRYYLKYFTNDICEVFWPNHSNLINLWTLKWWKLYNSRKNYKRSLQLPSPKMEMFYYLLIRYTVLLLLILIVCKHHTYKYHFLSKIKCKNKLCPCWHSIV